MRVDRFLVENGICSRKEAKNYAKKGLILVNNKVIKDVSLHIDENNDEVIFNHEKIEYKKNVYIMLNKPAGYVSSTEDFKNPYVCELLDERLQKMCLFPVGRLDKDTTGLLILTNNGQLAHELLTPKHHIEKEYSFSLDHSLILDAENMILKGLKVDKGLICKPAILKMEENRQNGIIILTEGKYHEIKRMMIALDNKIVSLKRERFAGISLDNNLNPGEYRYLNKEEVERLEKGRMYEENNKK